MYPVDDGNTSGLSRRVPVLDLLGARCGAGRAGSALDNAAEAPPLAGEKEQFQRRSRQ